MDKNGLVFILISYKQECINMDLCLFYSFMHAMSSNYIPKQET